MKKGKEHNKQIFLAFCSSSSKGSCVFCLHVASHTVGKFCSETVSYPRNKQFLSKKPLKGVLFQDKTGAQGVSCRKANSLRTTHNWEGNRYILANEEKKIQGGWEKSIDKTFIRWSPQLNVFFFSWEITYKRTTRFKTKFYHLKNTWESLTNCGWEERLRTDALTKGPIPGYYSDAKGPKE